MVREFEFGLLIGGEREVTEALDIGCARVEAGDARALRFVADIAKAEDGLGFTLDPGLVQGRFAWRRRWAF
ncbi:hypothetical protein OHB26_00985 [Nocardia sp. NBC_01503]|uniref:hypothetical protein n=1 Tax=Nocardia sp. NBC_01503 TaxID=2975997 RepID=UPI002E7B2EF9|nr:hypothetical protein [Nocardia sp. NBC_01503]WTL32868.1 hypothetical protein OHB26_00985 [Nocardia sp. NBC_01503]